MVFKRWQIIAGIVWLVVSTVVQAASLGRVRGTALLGRGLDVSIQVNLDAQEALPEASCFAVEVFYGDTRVSPNTLSVSSDRNNSGESRVRIRSSSIVDEPVVTVFVRAGCNLSVSRRYVLLSEALSETEPGQAVPAAPVITLPPANRSAPVAASRGATSASESAATSAEAAAKRRAERVARRQERIERQKAQQPVLTEPAPFKAKVPRNAPESNKKAVARLEVDLLDFTSADIGLRGSSELTSLPSSDQAVRSQAQALWKALNATPEEAMREQQRLDALETQSRATLEQKKRLESEISKLSVDLKTAQDARYVNPFTIFLGLLCLASLGFGAWAWQRSKNQGQPWWGGKSKSVSAQDEAHLWGHLSDGAEPFAQPASKPESKTYSGNLSAPSIKPQGDVVANQVALSIPQQPARPANTGPSALQSTQAVRSVTESFAPSQNTVASSRRAGASMASQAHSSRGRSGFGQTDFASSNFSGSRVVAAEELFDIQEQADFFLSLDQPDQAIEVLKNHITENVETSALAYMDLFDIYHRTNRESDYAELREQFNHVFNAQVPEFEKYGAPSRGLEDVPEVLRSVQEVWGTPAQAQDVIEESIFRQPGQKPLDMLAYRELMLLYSLAKELSRPDAKFSMMPVSMQSASMSSVSGLSVPPDLELELPSAQADLLPMGSELLIARPTDQAVNSDVTVKMPNWTDVKDDGVDFDLSDSELASFKLPPASEKK